MDVKSRAGALTDRDLQENVDSENQLDLDNAFQDLFNVLSSGTDRMTKNDKFLFMRGSKAVISSLRLFFVWCSFSFQQKALEILNFSSLWEQTFDFKKDNHLQSP